MLSVRDARKALYRMLKQNFVQVQEVPKRADRFAKHSFFLWCVARVVASCVPCVLRIAYCVLRLSCVLRIACCGLRVCLAGLFCVWLWLVLA
jgi:hypothetical protein